MKDEAVTIGQALEGPVHTFADPWPFLRELVPNDAFDPEFDAALASLATEARWQRSTS